MRNWLAACAAVMVLTLAGGAIAQPAQTAKVVVVDIGEIIRSSLAGQDLSRQLENQNAALEAERAGLETEFRAAEQDLVRQQGILSPEAFEEKRRAVGQKFAAAQNDLQDKARRFQIARGKAEAELQRELTPIYQSILTKHGANLILGRGQIVMPGPGLDVTREVIDKLDQALPSIKLEIPPAGTAG